MLIGIFFFYKTCILVNLKITDFVTGLVAYLSEKFGVTFYLLGLLSCLRTIQMISHIDGAAEKVQRALPKRWRICCDLRAMV